MTRDWDAWIDSELASIRGFGRWRAHRALDGDGVLHRTSEGHEVVSFASNDYLGLTQHREVVAAAREALDRWGAGSGSARLIVGTRPVHVELETELAAWKSEPAALTFATGFAANLGVLTTFGGPGVLVCSDALNHASIIDGCRLARADVCVYPHGDLVALDGLLTRRGDRRALVVTDSVFSMDGDVADIDGIVEHCLEHEAMLVLDEAHAVLGPEPDPDRLAAVAHVRVGTLSKTLGSLGGFVSGSHEAIDLLVNRARSAIFTTASTPADTAAGVFAPPAFLSPEGNALIGRLRRNVDRVAPGHPSPIIPVIVGKEDVALAAAAELLDRGLLVPAIRPPTVAPGSSRLRVTLSAAHSDDHIDRLLGALDELGLHP
jgi:8-amino-7-oxononanoate synthase